MVKNLPAKATVRSLGWEDPLEKEMATHSSIPTWEIPWTEEPGGLQSMGWRTHIRAHPAPDLTRMFMSLVGKWGHMLCPSWRMTEIRRTEL